MNARVKPEPSQGSPSNPEILLTEPSAARIATAISAFAYTSYTATMDIVDNSVESGAHGVSVTFDVRDKGVSRIVFADNGGGIPMPTLNEVLRAGSRTHHLYTPTSLSRYGVGLKGAGFSMADSITVLTRADDGAINRRAIDRKTIVETDRWTQEARQPTAEECSLFEQSLNSLPGERYVSTGTVVILERVKLPTRDIAKLRTELVRGIGETYGKFLAASFDGEIQRLAIRVDNQLVSAIDPLHRENPSTLLIMKREKVDFGDGTSAFLTAVALPHPNTLDRDTARNYRFAQKYQGIYVYRNGRLVRQGETFGLFNRDFHLNAFRAELEYSSAADKHFPIDVAKSTIGIDDEASTALKAPVQAVKNTANLLWREKDILTKEDIADLFTESNRLIGARVNLLVEAINKRKGELARGRSSPAPQPSPAPHPSPETEGAAAPAPTPEPSSPPEAGRPPVPKSWSADRAYLRPADNLPGGVLYRPRWDGEVGTIVVDVNLAHPFAKAVFEVSPGEPQPGEKRGVPRRATTAVQQLLYVLGFCEYTMATDDDGENARMFEQHRRYVSMNLTALLE